MTQSDQTARAEEMAELVEQLHTLFKERKRIVQQLLMISLDAIGESGITPEQSRNHPREPSRYHIDADSRAPLDKTQELFTVAIEDRQFYGDVVDVADYANLGEAILCASSHHDFGTGSYVFYRYNLYERRGRLIYLARDVIPGWWYDEGSLAWRRI